MAFTQTQPAPIGNAFETFGSPPCRRESFLGSVPCSFREQRSPSGSEPGGCPGPNASSTRPRAQVSVISVESASTCDSEAVEPISEPEEYKSEPWPDTDDEDDDYIWTPSSRAATTASMQTASSDCMFGTLAHFPRGDDCMGGSHYGAFPMGTPYGTTPATTQWSTVSFTAPPTSDPGCLGGAWPLPTTGHWAGAFPPAVGSWADQTEAEAPALAFEGPLLGRACPSGAGSLPLAGQCAEPAPAASWAGQPPAAPRALLLEDLILYHASQGGAAVLAEHRADACPPAPGTWAGQHVAAPPELVPEDPSSSDGARLSEAGSPPPPEHRAEVFSPARGAWESGELAVAPPAHPSEAPSEAPSEDQGRSGSPERGSIGGRHSAEPCGLGRSQEVTTLMLRNLPRWLTQKGLVNEIHASGFEGRCDFCYMPQDFHARVNHGHAFVNLTSAEAAAEFRRAWQQKREFSTAAGHLQSPINISTAKVQGLAANMSSPRMKRVRNSTFRPFVLEGGAAEPCVTACDQ